jgi:hypothetical protein
MNVSRYEVPTFAWRLAVAALAGALLVTALLAGAIMLHGAPPTPRDLLLDASTWTIDHGTLDRDHVQLRPASNLIGTALYPIESPTFTFQSRIQIDQAGVAAGLIYAAQDANHFSAFLISPDGYFTLSDYAAGVWQERVSWRTWPHIRRDAESNALRVECTAVGCTFFVNDEWTWHINDRAAAEAIGVAARSLLTDPNDTAHFDQIELWD